MINSRFICLGPPTNFGLHPKKKEDWIKGVLALRQSSYVSENQQTYVRHPDTAFPHRYASAPKYLSSHFNPISRVSKYLSELSSVISAAFLPRNVAMSLRMANNAKLRKNIIST